MSEICLVLRLVAAIVLCLSAAAGIYLVLFHWSQKEITKFIVGPFEEYLPQKLLLAAIAWPFCGAILILAYCR